MARRMRPERRRTGRHDNKACLNDCTVFSAWNQDPNIRQVNGWEIWELGVFAQCLQNGRSSKNVLIRKNAEEQVTHGWAGYSMLFHWKTRCHHAGKQAMITNRKYLFSLCRLVEYYVIIKISG